MNSCFDFAGFGILLLLAILFGIRKLRRRRQYSYLYGLHGHPNIVRRRRRSESMRMNELRDPFSSDLEAPPPPTNNQQQQTSTNQPTIEESISASLIDIPTTNPPFPHGLETLEVVEGSGREEPEVEIKTPRKKWWERKI